MKQEKEAQSRFLISLSFLYCWRWMEPDDEFSLICFRPISEKTRTTSQPPIRHFVVYRKRPPKTCPTEWNEPPETLATITPTIQGSWLGLYSKWRTTPSLRTNGYETLLEGHSISISRTTVLARAIIVFQCLFHLVKFLCIARKLQRIKIIIKNFKFSKNINCTNSEVDLRINVQNVYFRDISLSKRTVLVKLQQNDGICIPVHRYTTYVHCVCVMKFFLLCHAKSIHRCVKLELTLLAGRRRLIPIPRFPMWH